MSKAIAYILNPEKTDEKLLVSSYGCASETAAREFEWTRKIAEQKGMNPVRIIARHVIQSFEIGEVTPELAHEIGKQFADEILGGKYEYVLTTHIDKDHVHNHLIFNAVDFVDYHAYKSYKRIYYDMREVSDRLCKENGLSVIPPSQNKGMGYKEYTEAKRGTSWKQKLKQTIDRLVITAKDYDDFLRLMQEAGYEIKTGKYISFRAEGQERFTRSKTIGENYTEERIKERIAGRTPRRNRRQTVPKGISLIGDIQERIRLIDSKGYEYKAKLTILKEAARTLNYLTENNLLQYADLEKKVEDVHSSYDRTGKELKGVEARLREVQPLIKNISNYQRLKPVYDAFQKAKDKPGFKAKHEAELVIFEAARSTLLAMQGDEKLPSLKTLQAQQQRLLDEQQRLYDERAKLKKEVKQIETIKSNVDTFLAPSADHDRDHLRSTQRE
ncbi:endonuclease [Faecalibacterium duncaniae]|uniref:Relaxase/mobilization nuclease domain protein n=1 Tax=Faecalibacterium duncaniae (strain DSM 17677 / JCM 31915 / A2-165) TaxID=411483 RepID=C7H8Q0_FAED2|nr:endonuclease [Faecalibacterium duncaniae]EEU95755.1 relaxase/mobilization nuclease domain protein [Faecalibacterium duncaniae]MSD30712.1 relaxase/mobilization nuclease domain-containing protein [Faecalibacterium sp. BIOML-A4]MSD49254.1 relaxase/mobilization nuclease domain-containing protein [Faecalibacterium sp. BIOML-A3]QIA44407.1 relaxase/mobilization nuclease domain-containing protein [Faecalibacterium duncaniae]